MKKNLKCLNFLLVFFLILPVLALSSCGKKDNKDFQISDTQNTIFTKKEFVNKNGEQISYNGYLGKEKPKNYVIYLDGEEISIDWNESDIMIV